MEEKGNFGNMTPIHSMEEGMDIMDKMVKMARPETVFAQPITSGEIIAIPASESIVGLGFGFGYGYGEDTPSVPEGAQVATPGRDVGSGGGGGGGGYSATRPVAVIQISPGGVSFTPVVDVTKLGIAFFTTLGAMFFMFRRMLRPRRM